MVNISVKIELIFKLKVYRRKGIFFQRSKQLEQRTRIALTSFRSKIFPPIKRGAKFDVYLSSSGWQHVCGLLLFIILNLIIFAN